MSAPSSFPSGSTDGSTVLDDRLYPEVNRCDQYPEVHRQRHQYPEVNREYEILEIVRDYPEVIRCDQDPEINKEHESLKTAKDYPKDTPEKHENRTCNYRILGVRSWVLVVLICIVALAVAIAIGLAIGIPASIRKTNNLYVLSVIFECTSSH